jgi:hypothetical protein
MADHSHKHDEPKLRTVLRDDIEHGDFIGTMRKEYADLREYFLSEGRKQQLHSMSAVKKFFFAHWWLLKSLLLKLNWIRRLILLCAVYFMFNPIRFESHSKGMQIEQNTYWVGFLLVLFLLMLELKDKLLAKSELAAGRTVQQALMPEMEPQVAGWSLWLYYHPANEVCGDLLDFLRIEEWRSAIALGDVSDKGLGAALLMVKLQATLRALAPDHTDLGQLAAKMNEIYLRDGVAKSFASLVYLELHPNSGSVQLFNAGHLPPLHLHAGKIIELTKGDTALGLKTHAEFNEQQIDLHSGDVLFIYSDGLTEARNSRGDFFGEARLHALLNKKSTGSARQIGEAILYAVSSFIEDAPRHDDLSIAVLVKQ